MARVVSASYALGMSFARFLPVLALLAVTAACGANRSAGPNYSK
jgi:hypothetical protein